MATTISQKSSVSKIASAASLATSVAEIPIAKPTSAALRAGESPTPSPVVATTSLFIYLQLLTMTSFWAGLVRAKTIYFLVNHYFIGFPH
jgi:hypothetical protein